MKTHITHVAEKYSVLIVVQFHPWFKFYFLCFKRIVIHVHYHTQKQNKIKFKPRMELNLERHPNKRGTWNEFFPGPLQSPGVFIKYIT